MAPVDIDAHRDARNGRIRIHPALLQMAVSALIFIASLVAGYYSGRSQEAQKTSELGTRVSVLEEQAKELRANVSDIRSDVKELLRRLP